MKNAWIYARQRGNNAELQRQLDQAKAFARAKGYRVIGISTDDWDDWLWRRRGLREMLRTVRAGKTNAVVVQRITVISHRDRTLFWVLKYLQTHHAVLIPADGQLSYTLATRGLERPLRKRAQRYHGFLPWAAL